MIYGLHDTLAPQHVMLDTKQYNVYPAMKVGKG